MRHLQTDSQPTSLFPFTVVTVQRAEWQEESRLSNGSCLQDAGEEKQLDRREHSSGEHHGMVC